MPNEVSYKKESTTGARMNERRVLNVLCRCCWVWQSQAVQVADLFLSELEDISRHESEQTSPCLRVALISHSFVLVVSRAHSAWNIENYWCHSNNRQMSHTMARAKLTLEMSHLDVLGLMYFACDQINRVAIHWNALITGYKLLKQ